MCNFTPIKLFSVGHPAKGQLAKLESAYSFILKYSKITV
jgi:hypothetical protein